MYRCKDCGAIFERPSWYEENVGEYWGFPAYETFYMCPCCNSDDFEPYYEDEDEFMDYGEDE